MHLVPPTDSVLWTPAASVTDIATQVLPHVESMRELMKGTPGAVGVALAAPQVGISLRFFVTVDHVFVNPVIVAKSRGYLAIGEGCLSFPGQTQNVWRYGKVTLKFLDKDGTSQRWGLTGFGAQVAAHECSHLDGICLFDRPSISLDTTPQAG